ncbi:MAG: GNAT family N-acetyltransferase [Bacteroidetes bacterium]|nr:GNAT family N-acetyltransferase [Bacteroidota bacterium]
MNINLKHINWVLKTFETLTPFELYDILKLRSEVFVVEQNCVFLDADSKDQFSYHLLGFIENNLVAYTRLIAARKAYNYASIGRVVTSAKYRKLGIGKELMEVSIKKCYELFGETPIKIGAQLYLKNFYELLGFTQSSQVYDEDGIDHIEMIKPAP